MHPEDVAAALAAHFDPAEVKWKPQTVSGSRALVIGYVDARVIMDRLDEVVGVGGWQDRYERLPDGAVVCRLRVLMGGRWITKEDVGGQSEQPDEGDRTKAAFSDALKRAAVKFGVGRYLYRLKNQWMDYDPQKRQIVGTPRLPAPPPDVRASRALLGRIVQEMAEARDVKALEAVRQRLKTTPPALMPAHKDALLNAYGDRLRALATKEAGQDAPAPRNGTPAREPGEEG